LFSGKLGFYEMPEDRSIDIDSSLDWEIVKMIMEKKE
jgi:CMP-N-acetylneuraminic acid synthetase